MKGLIHQDRRQKADEEAAEITGRSQQNRDGRRHDDESEAAESVGPFVHKLCFLMPQPTEFLVQLRTLSGLRGFRTAHTRFP